MDEDYSKAVPGMDGSGNEMDSEDKDYGGEDDGMDDDGYRRNMRGGGHFRGRGRGLPPPGWMNGPPPGCPPPMRFRGRGYGPGGPPMRGRGFFRGRGGPPGPPRFNGPPNGPNFDGNWGMGPPPPMMGGPPPFGPPPPMMGPGGPMGPPPSLMGQPPFGGPPGMPPPNMMQEVWVETKSDDGKSYYYHSRTRETTWTRPVETPACKVITQAEMEGMAASGQLPAGMNGPMGVPPMGGPPMGMPGMMGMMPPGPRGAPPGQMPFMGIGPPPWIIKENNNKQEEQEGGASGQDSGNEGNDDSQGSQQHNGEANDMFNKPPNFSNSGMSGPPPGFPGPGWGAPGAWPSGPPPSWPPPLIPPVNQPPPNLSNPPPVLSAGAPLIAPPLLAASAAPASAATPASVAAPSSTTQPMEVVPQKAEPAPAVAQPPKEEDETIEIPPEVIARAAEWTTHKSPEGRPYYYCAKKGESVWEKPLPLKELDELNEKIAARQRKAEVIDVEAHEKEKLERAAAELQAAEEKQKREAEEKEKEREEREKREKEEKERLEREKEEKEKQDRNKSKWVMHISGTPWCLVWTGDGSVFFYHPTAQKSVWERPEELMGRADVDKALSAPPEAIIERKKKESSIASGAMVSIGGGAVTGAAVASANDDLKRAAAESDSEDSDKEPAKKAKTDTAPGTKKVTQIDAGKEAAMEAEVRAARERAVVPLETRIDSFRQMLQEKEVSAFSTWEKELHKIVFDSRYLLLTSKERKQVFEKYVRERADEERKEKRNKLKQKKDNFRLLMEEAKLHSKSSYTDFSTKYSKDERFRGIEKTRERESLFNEYIVEVRKKEKEEKAAKREQARKDFLALLKEKEVDRHGRWNDLKKKLDSEARYKAVESSALREELFREYCKMAKDEKKKDKDKEKDKTNDRESRSSRKDKDKKEKEKDRDHDKDKEKEKKSKEKSKKGSDEETSEAEGGAEDAARERAARAEASIKEREREVQRALATSLRDRDKEREQHKRDEAVQHFNALLADLVRNADLAWRDARKQLKKDHRYAHADLLSKEDKERLFTAHTTALGAKRRDKFRELLDELGVTLTAYWRDVRKKCKDDPRASKFSSPDKCEREFRDYQRDRLAAAKVALRELLQETRTLTHRTLAAVKENKQQLRALHDSLKHDARYLVLSHIEDEREEIIMSYLEELEKKGPPPPPTATEPTRRPKN